MVSIPDWSKFARLHDSANNRPKTLQSRYYKQREYEAVRQAEEHGYFFKPDADFLLKKFNNSIRKGDVKDVHYVRYVQLDGVHLRSLGDLGICMRLRICDLSNNYLTRFDALGTCRQLVKLDLHCNQISYVPSIAFWSGLKHLRILYLHDNPIGRIENIHFLGATRRLVFLTLQDTPLSLKKNYRHHVVNSIWSLKALDNYVISDEEIIEETTFFGHFSAMDPAFYINLSPTIPPNSTYEEHLVIINQLMKKVNSIMAKHSPVLIVQRHIRGHLTRNRYKLVQETRVWAVIVIQRKWRDYKGVPQLTARSEKIPPPPSSSPVNDDSELTTGKQVNSTAIGQKQPERPSSTPALSETSAKFRQGYGEPRPTPESGFLSKSAGSKPSTKFKSLIINLTKLESGTLQTLQDDAQALESEISGSKFSLPPISYLTPRREKIRPMPVSYEQDQEPQRIQQKVKDVKQFFGPVVPSISSQGDLAISYCSFIDGDIPVTQFRLKGFKPTIYEIDPMAELIISRQEAAHDIRDAEDEYHRQQQMIPKPRILPKKTKTNNDRYFQKTQGTMGLSCLQAVHNAYKDRARAEKTAIKMEKILSMRNDRDAAKHQIKLYHEEKRNNIMNERQQEQSKIMELLEKREVRRLRDVDRAHELRNKAVELSKNIMNEYTFVGEFNTQHTSVSNALTRYDRQTRKEDVLNDNLDKIQASREHEVEQRDVIKRFLEHRQLTRQAESTVEREELETQVLKDANDRMMQAHARVAQLRMLRKKAREMCPLPTESRLSYPPENVGPPIPHRVGKHPQTTFIPNKKMHLKMHV